jgi:hypothetical protein
MLRDAQIREECGKHRPAQRATIVPRGSGFFEIESLEGTQIRNGFELRDALAAMKADFLQCAERFNSVEARKFSAPRRGGETLKGSLASRPSGALSHLVPPQ